MLKKTKLLVTGVGGRSVGNQILYALLLLGNKYEIIATDADAFSFGLYETPSRYIVPYANDKNYIPAISQIIENEKIDVILPGTEPETLILSEHKEFFLSLGCSVISSPTDVVRICDDKKHLAKWLEENNYSTPKTSSLQDWRLLADKVGFPIIGKPAKNTGGSKNVSILKDASEVERYLRETNDPEEIIFQEYVGTSEDEYTVGVLIGKLGRIIDSIVLHRKLTGLSLAEKRIINNKAYSLSTGYSQGFIVKNNIIQKTCENLALTMGIRGPANIQCRLVNDKVVIFEVHARFSGTTSIRAEAGFNEPDLLIRNYLHGEEFNRIDYKSDIAAIRAFRHILVPISELKNIPNVLD